MPSTDKCSNSHIIKLESIYWTLWCAHLLVFLQVCTDFIMSSCTILKTTFSMKTWAQRNLTKETTFSTFSITLPNTGSVFTSYQCTPSKKKDMSLLGLLGLVQEFGFQSFRLDYSINTFLLCTLLWSQVFFALSQWCSVTSLSISLFTQISQRCHKTWSHINSTALWLSNQWTTSTTNMLSMMVTM